ncbi:universal stress protein [Shewanella sp. Isolate8]|uniref:universal stress protein n=1 Tax=Shewanella sp. Isolate8 TaxID=2908529 RepID=UPI001EFE3CA8|nr:universal stress protein [Shewanella sp. Isolate8]MCG9747045.1 universal stress protein [Shewanella sp. Isolate8]
MSYKHILVAVDLSESSQSVIDKAVSLAKAGNSKVSFVFVDVDSVAITLQEEIELQEKLQILATLSDYPIAETLVVIGDLHMKLAGIAKEHNIDLLVCGHHHKFSSNLFSSLPKVANAVEADLLVVYLDH